MKAVRHAQENGHRAGYGLRSDRMAIWLVAMCVYAMGIRPASTRSTASRSTVLRFLRDASRIAP